MKTDLGHTLKKEPIRSLALKQPVFLGREASLVEAIRQMCEHRVGYVLVLEKEGSLAGIFTERDVMTRVLESGMDMKTRVEKVMTPKPKCLKTTDSVAEAIRLMNKGGYRHLPLVDEKGRVEGVLSVKAVVRYLAEHFPYEIYNLPPDPHQVQKSPDGA